MMRGERTGNKSRTRRAVQAGQRRLGKAFLGTAIGLCVLVIAGSLYGAEWGSDPRAAPLATNQVQVVSDEQVVLLPQLGGGEGGWCLTTLHSVGCPSAHARVLNGPIIIEDWSGSSPPPSNQAVVLTTSAVATIALGTRAAVATRAEPTLPAGLRAAVIELRGASRRSRLGIAEPPPPPHVPFVPHNAQGSIMATTNTPGPPLGFELPRRSWGPAAVEPRGICQLSASGATGLAFQGGEVMTALSPRPDVRGREFVDCIRTSYILDRWPIEANILLDAAHPGASPGPLLATRPLPGHAGVVQGPGVEGDTLARRIPGAWLVVGQGADDQQRLELLEHLRTTIRTGANRPR